LRRHAVGEVQFVTVVAMTHHLPGGRDPENGAFLATKCVNPSLASAMHPRHDANIRPILSPEVLEKFTLQHLTRGYLVSTPGINNDRVLFLREGRIRVFVACDDKELTLAYLTAGELFSTHSNAYLRCESACELLSISTAEFARSLAHEPGMLGMVMPVLGRILDNSIALIEDLAFRDVAGRLARFLLVSARQHGRTVAPGISFTLDLSVGEIALLLGCTRQTVSSLLKRLEREAIIARPSRKQFRILLPESLLRWQEGGVTPSSQIVG